MKPTTDSMLDAIAHAKVNKDGVTRSVDLTAKDPGSYPLTLQVSAALSTKAPEAERGEMARFLSYVADAGQVSGDDVGQLPAGHAPLDATLRGQVLAARKAVLEGLRRADRDPLRVGLAHGRPHRPVGRTLRRRRRCPTRRGGARPG